MKPIIITDEIREQMLKEFEETLRKSKMTSGEISYNKKVSFSKEAEENLGKAHIVFTHKAFAKMTTLIMSFSSEVAWHGLIRRVDSEKDHVYEVYDILVYPQEVTGGTVNTDQAGYEDFLMRLSDEQANALFFHGHSHVNFACTPSSVDRAHQEQFIRNIRKDGFCVFMIWNKKFEHWASIYDLRDNILFENADITIDIGDIESGDMLSEFLGDAETKVQKKETVVSAYTGKTYPTVKNSVPTKKPEEKKKAAASKKKGVSNNTEDDDEEWLDEQSKRYGQYGGYSAYQNGQTWPGSGYYSYSHD